MWPALIPLAHMQIVMKSSMASATPPKVSKKWPVVCYVLVLHGRSPSFKYECFHSIKLAEWLVRLLINSFLTTFFARV
jgi:hypothetical protein